MTIIKPEKCNNRSEMTVWGWITPALAASYLVANTMNPRPISPLTVERYVKEMKDGSWTTHHQGIAFDREGKLIDGQHRLTAIVETGMSFYMPVTFNLPVDAKNNVDQPKVRSKNDILRGVGFTVTGKSLSGIIKCVIAGNDNQRALTNKELIRYARRLFDGLKFVDQHFNKKVGYVSTAPVKAAIVRAFFACETKRNRLARFCEILETGIPNSADDGEIMVIRFRERLKEDPTVRAGSAVNEVYAKTERVIQAFLNGEDLKAFVAPKCELFPMDWIDSSAALQAVAVA